VERYDFEILKGDRKIAARMVALADARSMWPSVVAFARDFGQPGDRIRVTNQAGEVTVRIGVAAARLMGEDHAAEREMTCQ